MWPVKKIYSTVRDFARAVCPQDELQDFDICVNEIGDFIKRIQEMMEKNSKEFSDLDDFIDSRLHGGGVKELMELFAEIGGDLCDVKQDDEECSQTYRQRAPNSHYLGATARRFLDHRDKLSPHVKTLLDNSSNHYNFLVRNAVRVCARRNLQQFLAQEKQNLNRD